MHRRFPTWFWLVIFTATMKSASIYCEIYDVRKVVSDADIGLSIMGTIQNTDRSNSVVLIKELQTGHVKAMKVGFNLLSRYQVVDVQLKFIVLKDQDASQFLVYADKFGAEFTLSSGSERLAARSSINVKVEGFERVGNKVSMTEAYRDRLINQDLSKILMDATAIPNQVGNEIKGFRILQITPGSIYDQAGLLDDDVVTNINGTPLTSVPQTIKFLQTLKKEKRVVLEVARGSSFTSLEVNVN